MKRIFFFTTIFLLSIGCQKQDCNCFLIPDSGPCFGYVTTYFYNQNTSQCEETYWGGCDGVVPFWTMSECQSECVGN